MTIRKRIAICGYGAALVAGAGMAAMLEWRQPFEPLAPFLALLGLSIASVVMQIERGPWKISAAFLAVMLAAAFLSPLAAAAIGVVTMMVNRVLRPQPWGDFVSNLATWGWFPLLAGFAFDAVDEVWRIGTGEWLFALVFIAISVAALIANFLLVAFYTWLVEGTRVDTQVRDVLVPIMPSELASVVLGAAVAMLYAQAGLPAAVLIVVVLAIFQYLVSALLAAHDRSTQLASLSMGIIGGMVAMLDLRDHMTARHSAAVARYAREMAKAAGLSVEQQELVHTAGLLHDIGKFIFPDRILKGGALEDGDWDIIRQHPAKGAEVLWRVDGYGPIAEVVHSHHERMDGRGYPLGLTGDEIPELSRIISVADTYDVMTAKASYKRSYKDHESSREEALSELTRVAGSQLDERYVEIMCELVRSGQTEYRHAADSDFDHELSIEKRIRDLAGTETQRWWLGGWLGRSSSPA